MPGEKIMVDTRKFDKEWESASKIILEGSEQVIRASAIELSTEIIKRTPVDTGRLRGNWQPTVNGPAQSALIKKDKTGQSTINKVKTKTNEWDLNETFYLTNNLVYAQYIENGTDKIKPKGMVKTTLRDFRATVKKQGKKKGFK